MNNHTLFVPIEIKALVVNDQARKGQNFQRWQMNYKNLASYASPMPDAFSGNTAIDWNNTPGANGVYLHWTLPDALRKGTQQNVAGTTGYPLVPNRWLILRYSGPLTGRTASAWIVESDFLDPNDGTSPFISPTSTDQPLTTLIGRKIDIAEWNESASGDLFLTAVSPGNIAFSAYQPYAENVFSIHDPLTGVAGTDTLSYLVAGWYSNPTSDILAGASDEAKFQQLLTDLDWKVDASETDPCDLSLYHGQLNGIAWDLSGPIPTSLRPSDPGEVSLAVGNTSIDALTALIQKQSTDAQKGDLIDAGLLEAFQYNLLPLLDQPNGADLLYQAIHKAWFGSQTGGYEWVIVKSPADQSGTDPRIPYPDSPVDWTDPNLEPDWLATLNQFQSEFDQAARELQSLQWRLYSLWWTKGKFDSIGPSNQSRLKSKDPAFTDSNFSAQLNPDQSGTLSNQTKAQTATVAALMAKIPFGNTQAELQRSIQSYASSHLLPEGYELKRYAKESFHAANDPVVLISGAKSSDSLVSEEALFCRYSNQLVTGLTYNAKSIDVASMKGNIPAVNLSALPVGIGGLLNEFFFLDPNNATMIATIAIGDSSQQTIQALTAQMQDLKDLTGTLPGILPEEWTQPWTPLFLLWTAFYYPIAHDTNQVENWTFDGKKYVLIDPNLPENDPQNIVLSGTILLTPQSSFNFKKRLDEFRKNHPDLDADELDALESFITDTDDWDFLSQALDGFTQQLACRDNESNVVPSGSSVVGTLIAANNSIVPNLGNPPEPFKGWPTSNFQQYRSGQFCFEKLMVVDRFGQSIELATSRNYLQIKPILAPDMVPAKTVLSQEPYRFIQLSPRLLQPARLNFDFVSAMDDAKIINLNSGINPVCAWILPNHIDRALACFDPAGIYLGELDLITSDAAQKEVHWEFAPDSPYSSLQQIAEEYPHLGEMLNALISHGPEAFENFYQVIDETLWVVDPLGARDDQNLSVLVGRPLALTRARLQYELDGPPLSDPSWEYVFQPSSPEYVNYTFPVRLGELKLRNDGLIGFFSGSDYNTFNSVHLPEGGTYTPANPPFINQIGPGNFIDLTLQQTSQSYITMLIDPRASVHATTGILPTSILNLPARFVEPALGSMDVVFHTGPVLSSSTSHKDPSSPSNTEETLVLLPKPAEKNGVWSWMTQVGQEWNTCSIQQPDARANFSNVPAILRTGLLKLSGALDKNSKK